MRTETWQPAEPPKVASHWEQSSSVVNALPTWESSSLMELVVDLLSNAQATWTIGCRSAGSFNRPARWVQRSIRIQHRIRGQFSKMLAKDDDPRSEAARPARRPTTSVLRLGCFCDTWRAADNFRDTCRASSKYQQIWWCHLGLKILFDPIRAWHSRSQMKTATRPVPVFGWRHRLALGCRWSARTHHAQHTCHADWSFGYPELGRSTNPWGPLKIRWVSFL